MREKLKHKINEYIENEFEYIYNLTINICKIPSMTGFEKQKANFILMQLKELGIENAYIDDVGNVIYLHNINNIYTHNINNMCPHEVNNIFQHKADNKYENNIKNKSNVDNQITCVKETTGKEGITVVAAHIDTVFKDLWNINPIIKENKIYAPSILDNSVNVAGLLFCIKIIRELDILIKKPFIFAFNVGEEGLGNLKGIKHIVDTWKDRIDEVIALDLGYKDIVDTAVGSRRYRIIIETEGGHSWKNFRNSNAILHAAEIVKDIYNIKVPNNPKTTYNVGIIKGGTSINTIAERAEMEVDLRSVDKTCLDNLYRDFINIINSHKSVKAKISIKALGERPCGKTYHDTKLIKRIKETRHELGMETNFRASSTDANYPISLGIPSISFGIGDGNGVHTMEEYLIIDSIKTGMKHLMHFMLKYCFEE